MTIALLGYGLETESAYKYYKKLYPMAEFVAYDDHLQPKSNLPSNIKFIGNQHDFHDIQADIVVRTPATAPSRVSSDNSVTSLTKEFFAMCSALIIGVTGTKGKGTTCSLIVEILKAAGHQTWLVGNIGTPALDVISEIKPDDIVVYELSSFQLWDLTQSPHVAVVLMIDTDHMDVHKDFDDYLRAKMNITLFQTSDDVVVYHPTNPNSLAIAQASLATKKKKFLSSEGAYIADKTVVINEQVICSIGDIGLLGEHNLENVCAAVTAAWEFTQDAAAIKQAIKNFKGLEHRLEFVREFGGIKFYNDSYSSTPSATMAAIRSFKQPEIVIIGGFNRRANFSELAQAIKAQTNIKKVFLIGETKQMLADTFSKGGLQNYEVIKSSDFKEVISQAFSAAIESDVVLLSPGCPSFDMFDNFVERGTEFKRIVGELS